MDHETYNLAYRRERFRGGWAITLCWLLPVMAVVAAGGYLFAQNMLAKKVLINSSIQLARPHPKPLLTPDEAAKVARDEASPVWSEGVKATDVPKLDPHDYAAERAKSYVFPGHHHGLRYRHGPKTASPQAGGVGGPDVGATTAPTTGGDNTPNTTPGPTTTPDKGTN